ncbi:uncharacterized protein B0P05DRAFT_641118 [Gilbertella persicaria]|uniref:uncharacterized protein n=1 Tax=Gilbertella persicaria TaxID=101096 RepID=UPI00221F78A4|nr:uncharacterized protein B0P05DRAFT_641118 [Gilbertella persicaria]KAI8056508.1 hypothetical protein B0P05DRAFT_641118 [Gilbertella persicaria]
MALLLNYQNNRRASLQGDSTLDSYHNPANQLFSNQSFKDVLKAQKQHIFEVSPNVENGSFKPLNAYSAFVEATERSSIVIDCAQFLGMEFKDKSLLKILHEQFPKCLGLKPKIIGKNKRKAMELGFSTENTLNGKKIELNKTLDNSAMVINIGISEILLMEEEVLKPALINTFERFGDILNISISKYADSDWFTGRSFATLNRDKLKETTYAAELTPQVRLVGFPGVLLNIVWSQMKPICTDCHTDEHTKFDGPKRARKLCFRCKRPKHLQAKCPTAP